MTFDPDPVKIALMSEAGKAGYTERATQALERAKQEAVNAGSEFIGTEHVLPGIAESRLWNSSRQHEEETSH
jgi:hypothetical protein